MTRLRAIEPNDIDLLFAVENDAALWVVGNTNMPYSRQFLTARVLRCYAHLFP